MENHLLSSSLSTLTSDISTINTAIGQPVGIATLDNNSFIPITNIPDLPQSKITNLSTTLSTLSSGINLINNEIGSANGTSSLDNNGKLISNQIPSLAVYTVTTVQTITDRNNLTSVDMGDIVLVINDSTSSNKGSYIYNGSGWSTLALYNTIGMLSNLSDVTLSSLSVKQISKWNGTKWVNTAHDDCLAILGDVTLSSVSNNQVLQYNSTLSKWVINYWVINIININRL